MTNFRKTRSSIMQGKLMRNPYRSQDRCSISRYFRCSDSISISDRANVNMLLGKENLSEFLTRKRRACFLKDKVIRECMVHYLKKNVPSSSELRKCLSLAFRKYIAVRMSRPRPQLGRNKSSKVGDFGSLSFLSYYPKDR